MKICGKRVRIVLNAIVLLVLILILQCKEKSELYESKTRRNSTLIFPVIDSVLAENWSLQTLQTPLEERIYPLTPIVKDYILAWNKLDNFKEIPEPYLANQEELQSLKKILSDFPKPLREFASQHLLGIYTVKNLGGTAMAGMVYQNKNPLYGFLILDMEMLNKTANEWASYKENTAFKKGPDTEIQLIIEDEKNNTRWGAVSFILLHELGHIFHEIHHLLPSYTDAEPDYRNTPFTKDIWFSDKLTSYDKQIPWRKSLAFYSETPALERDRASSYYKAMEGLPFPTLYSLLDPEEFFAESFASYIHCVMLKRPYKLLIFSKGKLEAQFENRILKTDMQKQREILKKHLKE